MEEPDRGKVKMDKPKNLKLLGLKDTAERIEQMTEIRKTADWRKFEIGTEQPSYVTKNGIPSLAMSKYHASG